eukprot:3609372-Lingulodinium_polyedra.AAC.1
MAGCIGFVGPIEPLRLVRSNQSDRGVQGRPASSGGKRRRGAVSEPGAPLRGPQPRGSQRHAP